jgi:hypothetical protein
MVWLLISNEEVLMATHECFPPPGARFSASAIVGLTRRILMKTPYRTLAVTFGVLILALLFVPNASAQCGRFTNPVATHAGWHYQPEQSRLLRTAFVEDDDLLDNKVPIVGLWHFKFTSKGNQAIGIPDGAPIDAGYAEWHSDGTEITNSGAIATITGNICMGMWQRVGQRHYKLNHFAIVFDSTGTNVVGPANIQEDVTVSPNGNSFTGTFTIDKYTEAGNKTAHVEGTVAATRITVNTPPESVF